MPIRVVLAFILQVLRVQWHDDLPLLNRAHTMKSRRLLLLCFAFPFLYAGSCKKKPVEEIEGTGEVAQAPEVLVQVVAIQPDRAEPEQAFGAQIFGQEFQEGARAWVGGVEVSQLSRVDENTLNAQVSGLSIGPQDIRVLNPDGTEATLRGGLVVRQTANDPTEGLQCDKIVIHFELDKAKLDEESGQVLLDHMASHGTFRFQKCTKSIIIILFRRETAMNTNF